MLMIVRSSSASGYILTPFPIQWPGSRVLASYLVGMPACCLFFDSGWQAPVYCHLLHTFCITRYRLCLLPDVVSKNNSSYRGGTVRARDVRWR